METCVELSDLLHCEEKSGVGCEAEKKKRTRANNWSEKKILSSTLFCCHQQEFDNVIASFSPSSLCHPSVAFLYQPIFQV